MSELKPCPFCGEQPVFPESPLGTQYEFECDCGLSRVGVQISDLMSITERQSGWDDDAMCYEQKYIDRAKIEAIKAWNTRTDTAIRTDTLDECVEIIRNMKGSHATTDYLDFIKAIDSLRGDK